MPNNNSVCRFCLKLASDTDVELINKVTQKILGVLLIKLDVEVSEHPIICKMCKGIVDEIYTFKSKCIYSEDIVSAHFESNLKVNLRDILIELKNKPGDHIAEDTVICRLCIKISPNGNYINLNETSDRVSSCRNMIESQLPEINLSFTEDPIICEACHVLLQNYLSFATNCTDVEQKIKMYCEQQGSGVKEQVDLLCVLQFTENKALDRETIFNEGLIVSQGESSVLVKVEKVEAVENDNLTEDNITDGSSTIFYIKEEPVEIKLEDDHKRMEIRESDQRDGSDSVGKSRSPKKKRCSPKKKRKVRHKKSEVKTQFCPECSYSSRYISGIKKHMRSQSHGKIWKCCLCSFTADNMCSQKTHLMSHRGPSNKLVCTECQYETGDYRRLTLHVLTHKDESEVEMHECRLCPYKNKSPVALTQHEKLQHDEMVRIYRCKECSWITKYKGSYIRHQLMHKNTEVFLKHKCTKCEYETKNKWHLANHILTHEEGKYKCEECLFHGKTLRDLRKHVTIHSDEKPFRKKKVAKQLMNHDHFGKSGSSEQTPPTVKTSMGRRHNCPRCPYFASRQYLVVYMHFDSDEELCKCSLCPFLTATGLSPSHKGPTRTFGCCECSYETDRKNGLKQHYLTHKSKSEMKMHTCGKCKYETKYKNNLNKHMLTHKAPSAAQKYKCKVCQMQCISGSRLKAHMTVHLRQYSCDQCTFSTKEEMNLVKHKHDKHTYVGNPSTQTLYECEYSTEVESDLKQHQLKHMEPADIYCCANCDYQTDSKRYLKIHIAMCIKKKKTDQNDDTIS